jgi:hypothetical protein
MDDLDKIIAGARFSALASFRHHPERITAEALHNEAFAVLAEALDLLALSLENLPLGRTIDCKRLSRLKERLAVLAAYVQRLSPDGCA